MLVTGPTGSGKSTTPAAMVDYINDNFHHHILTIEDPIEFVHENKRCLVNQREVHRDTKSFSNALRSALREDPDIILVGEMRDLETIRLAMTAAETGHLVFGTCTPPRPPRPSTVSSTSSPARRRTWCDPCSPNPCGRSSPDPAQAYRWRPGGGPRDHAGIPAVRNLIREDKVAQIYSVIQTGMTTACRPWTRASSSWSTGGRRPLDAKGQGGRSQHHLSSAHPRSRHEHGCSARRTG